VQIRFDILVKRYILVTLKILPKRQRPQGGRKGPGAPSFSMVEMLVVAAIISIMIAIITPAYRSIKEDAQRVQCLSNLRQIGAASALYLSDHNNVFPPAVDYVPWRGAFFPGSVTNLVDCAPQDIQAAFRDYIDPNSPTWVCPVAKRFARKDASSVDPYTLGNFGSPVGWGYKHDITYRWNSLATRDSGSMTNSMTNTRSYPQTLSRLKSPAHAALMWDLRDDLPNYGLPHLHRGKVNCVFVDGHVESVEVAIDGGGVGIADPNTLWQYAGSGMGEGWEGATVPYP
jgi:prepilin-type processing-associated H-X9-DG protein